MIALPLLLLAASLHATPKAEAADKKIYLEDVAKVKSGNLDFDWFEFRKAANAGGTDYFDWHPVRIKFQEKMKTGDPEAALKLANEIIDHNMAEPEGHLLALAAAIKLNRTEERATQFKIINAWLHSIQASGDGKSDKTAYVVVNEGEEYTLLNAIFGFGFPESQSLMNKNGHSYDLLKAKDHDGKLQEIWFNVDISMNVMKNALEAGKK